MIRIIAFVLGIFAYTATLVSQNGDSNYPINGISFIGPTSGGYDYNSFQKIKTTNSNWVALIPGATLGRSTLQIIQPDLSSEWGSTIEAQVEGIKLAKEAGLKIFLKPHIVLEKSPYESADFLNSLLYDYVDRTNFAIWRGDVIPQNEADWKTLEESYEAYIIDLAEVAQQYQVELFCIGTELREFVRLRPDYWNKLITKVRNIYSGKITYSANWDEYELVPFWDRLDYIGVDAYFPINESATPNVWRTLINWKPIKGKLRLFSEMKNKKILMTEFGYRSISYAGKSPWIHNKGDGTPNNTAQANLYTAFFKTFWNESWVVGGFAWNWMHSARVIDTTDFTMQDKEAMEIIQKWYN